MRGELAEAGAEADQLQDRVAELLQELNERSSEQHEVIQGYLPEESPPPAQPRPEDLPPQVAKAQDAMGTLVQATAEIKVFKFAAWPSRAQFRRWKLKFKKAVASGSGRHEECYKWISEVESAKSWRDLFDLPGAIFSVLNAKIASGLSNIIQGDLCKDVELIESELDKTQQMLNGRQLACLSTITLRPLRRKVI